jgi:hypothetical protein
MKRLFAALRESATGTLHLLEGYASRTGGDGDEYLLREILEINGFYTIMLSSANFSNTALRGGLR